MIKKYDKGLAILFGILTIAYIVVAAINKEFLDWVFERHHNQLSWYIRPLFLIPFCFFSYKRSLTGISVTIFLLITSMMWFPKPDVVNELVDEFLRFEVEYLTKNWTLSKILIALIVPASLFLLAFAFWQRNLWFGLSVVLFIAIGKMLWSVIFGGESGKSIMVPAVVGLFFCIGLIYWGAKRMQKNKNDHTTKM